MAYVSPVDRLMGEFGKSYMRMSLNELERYMRRLQKLTNRRYYAILNRPDDSVRDEAMHSSAWRMFEAEGGPISLRKGLQRITVSVYKQPNQTPQQRMAYLRAEARRAQSFINSPYSSSTQILAMSKKRDKLLEGILTKAQYQHYLNTKFKNSKFERSFWQAVDEYRKQYYTSFQQLGSERAIREIYDVFFRQGRQDYRGKKMSNERVNRIIDTTRLSADTKIDNRVAEDVLKKAKAVYLSYYHTRDVVRMQHTDIYTMAEKIIKQQQAGNPISYEAAMREVEADILKKRAEKAELTKQRRSKFTKKRK